MDIEIPLLFDESARKRWFVLRDLKRCNAKLPGYKQLWLAGIRQFTPMRQRLMSREGKRERVEMPVIPDLVFAQATRQELDPIVERTPTLQYSFVRGGGYCEPMVVRDEEMERFIHAIHNSESQIYYLPSEITPDMYGKEVRIIGGPLNEYTGRLLSVRGSRKRRLLIELPNFLTVAVEVAPEYIQFVNAKQK